MNVLIIYAHPEPKSLNGALKDFAVQRLEAAGHTVQVSDLYAMQWKATLDANDSTVSQNGLQTADIAAEQAKLRWADAVILQFPMWWFSMPAILKGWVERVYAYSFAYGVGEHSDTHWGDRYGEGTLAGKRAMLIVTTGGWESHYSPRGINGPIDDVLFPIDVLPPFVTHRAGRMDDTRFAQITRALGDRLDTLFTIDPIPFRQENAGDYEIPALTLRAEIAPDKSGFAAHIA